MSWQATSWALREAPVGSDTTARLLLMALADRAHPDGTAAWPSVATLMKELQVSESTIRRKLSWLEKIGVIERGDQSLAAHDEHGRTIPSPYRPVVWNLRMHADLEAVAEQPAKASEVPTSRPVKMTPLEESQNKAESRPVKMTPLNNDSGSRGVMDASVEVSPVTGKPLYKPNTPLPSKEGISPGEKIDDDVAQVEKVLWDALKLPFRPQRKDHQATRKLIDTYGLELVLAVAAWSTAPAVTAPGSKQDGFWRSVLRGSASLAKNWETIYLQMREDPKGAKQLKSTLTSEDNDSRLQCSTKSGKRYKIYRSGPITTGQAWDHLDGEILQDECIACRVDHRNRPLHGVGARDVNEMSCAPNDAQKQTLEKKYHFNGHRTTNNIYATI